jgi:hypothetical protein
MKQIIFYNTIKSLLYPLLSGKGCAMAGVVLLSLTGLFACQAPPDFGNTPSISFKSVDYVRGRETDSIIVAVDYKDGDGDLGLAPTEQEKEYNIFVDYFIKKEGRYEQVVFPSGTSYNGRFPRIKESNEPAPLQGDIKYTMSSFNFPFYRNDTIKLQVSIKDRAGNISNTVETTEIKVP